MKDYKYRHKYTADQVAKALGFDPKDCEVWLLSRFEKNIIEIQCDLPEPPTASNNGFNLTPPVDGAS